MLIEREDWILIMNALDDKIDWINRYAIHCPSSLMKREKLKDLYKRLDYLIDEFVIK